MLRTYSDLRRIDNFTDRFEYLKLGGIVGQSTFGFDRYLNQAFYRSPEWRAARREVIIRDNGCDLGIEGYEIHADILVHHMNPIEADDILHANEDIINPEYLITTTYETHNAIHFGNADLLRKPYEERLPGDTRLW